MKPRGAALCLQRRILDYKLVGESHPEKMKVLRRKGSVLEDRGLLFILGQWPDFSQNQFFSVSL
jgi:hypothetical protein